VDYVDGFFDRARLLLSGLKTERVVDQVLDAIERRRCFAQTNLLRVAWGTPAGNGYAPPSRKTRELRGPESLCVDVRAIGAATVARRFYRLNFSARRTRKTWIRYLKPSGHHWFLPL